MLQECGMKGLQNSLMASKTSPPSTHTCERTPYFALQPFLIVPGRSCCIQFFCMETFYVLWRATSLQLTFFNRLQLPRSGGTFKLLEGCTSANVSKNMRISPHMPPCLPGAPMMRASASRTSCWKAILIASKCLLQHLLSKAECARFTTEACLLRDYRCIENPLIKIR